MTNIAWAFMVGYLEREIRDLMDKAEADAIMERAETKAREMQEKIDRGDE